MRIKVNGYSSPNFDIVCHVYSGINICWDSGPSGVHGVSTFNIYSKSKDNSRIFHCFPRSYHVHNILEVHDTVPHSLILEVVLRTYKQCKYPNTK